MNHSFLRLVGTAAISLAAVVAWAADPASPSSSAAKDTPAADTPAASSSATDTPAASTSTSTSSSASRSTGSVEQIDVNTADAATLQRLPGITAEVAQAIIAARPFKSVDDLAEVQGVGEARLTILKDQLTVSSSTASTETKSTEPQLEPTGRTDSKSPSSSSSSQSDAATKSSEAKDPSSSNASDKPQSPDSK